MKRWFAALMMLGGCGAADEVGAPEEMSFASARSNLMRAAGSGSATAFCSDEGRIEFRRAVRTFSAAAAAENIELDRMQMSGNDEATNLIMIGVFARIVQPSDLRGQARGLATMLNMPGVTGAIGDTRDALAKACPETVTVYREAAAMMRLQARAEHAENMSPRDQQRLSERIESQSGRLQRSIQRLEARMWAEGWDGDSMAGLP
ncbi:hypothetical protein [Terricaulis sp.]|uniref:hypothetical protein n=1 Tax=Terricaulis sp. TaxID=2768686 RepID=UPI00378468E9